jgi:cell division protein FtsW (lipid II flippase)
MTFIIISFLRSGDFTKLILVLGMAFVGGLMILRFKSHVATRFETWGHIWELMDGAGYQQTRMLTAASSGGLVGLGAGEGWLGKTITASQTDLVFGLVTEEWGLIIAVLCVLAIITMAVFAVRSIWAGRSTFYTIAACAATSVFLFQTIFNVLGAVDLLPFTGVTFPFLSPGGSSAISAWCLLAFLKGADTREGASIAVKSGERSIGNPKQDGARLAMPGEERGGVL